MIFSTSKETKCFIVILLIPIFSFTQIQDLSTHTNHISGSATITNNGISLIPSFSLGSPAAIFNLSVGNEKVSFEPEFRVAFDGKPWVFLFWGRYKLLNKEKIKLNIGAHPAFAFRTIIANINGLEKEVIQTIRYVAGELSPTYILTKNISIGLYYLYSHGIDAGTIHNTHFVALNSNLSNIKLSKQLLLKLSPQVYYLNVAGIDGVYFSSSLALSKPNFPLSVSAFINKIINTNITASKDFLWSLNLHYAFL